MPASMAITVSPHPIDIAEDAITDLKERLARTRWPDAELVDDWSQGVPLSWLQDICRYWAKDYDWRRCEQSINALGSFKAEIGGLGIHFLHITSPHKNATPLLLSHGWPGSILEFTNLIPRLIEPEKYGGRTEDAFHVVVPALPGYGFSDKPRDTGWTVEKIADCFDALMQALGYTRYMAQGGDWGAMVTTMLTKRHSKTCRLIHLNFVLATPTTEIKTAPTHQEMAAMMTALKHRKEGTGYSKLQSTRPQTLGYGLTDSPVGQAAWILEKFYEWTDNHGAPDTIISRDHLLDTVMLYWLNASAASAARLYWESFDQADLTDVKTPAGCTIFPKEIATPSRRWAESRFRSILHWGEADKGGHFAALENPAFLAAEIRATLKAFKALEKTKEKVA